MHNQLCKRRTARFSHNRAPETIIFPFFPFLFCVTSEYCVQIDRAYNEDNPSIERLNNIDAEASISSAKFTFRNLLSRNLSQRRTFFFERWGYLRRCRGEIGNWENRKCWYILISHIFFLPPTCFYCG